MDFVVQVERLPAPGETTLGYDFRTIPGGKGANQAFAAGRLSRSTSVRMLGRVGADVFGEQLRRNLAVAGVDVAGIASTSGVPSGVALIWVDRRGQNSIVVAAGANAELTSSDLAAREVRFDGASVALFQLETPLETVTAGLAMAKAAGVLTVLDPAPAQPLQRELLALVDILTPNESEARMLLGEAPAPIGMEEAPEVAERLLALGVQAVILKLGAQGCFYSNGLHLLMSPGLEVEVIDTTAAGDTFNAALAIALAEDQPLEQALRFANTAAALSVMQLGASTSAPSRDEVDARLLW